MRVDAGRPVSHDPGALMRVVFQPGDRLVESASGRRILDIARAGDVGIAADCGGKGKCGRCRVQFERAALADGILSQPHPDEVQLLPDPSGEHVERLACRTRAFADVSVTIPRENQADDGSLRKPVMAFDVSIAPALSRINVDLAALRGEHAPDAFIQRVRNAIARVIGSPADGPDMFAMGAFSRDVGGESPGSVTATLLNGRHIVQLLPGRHRKHYGMAFDIGTTSIAGFLCNLSSGRTIASAAVFNPQRSFGADVVSRIAQVQQNPSNLKAMQQAVTASMNQLIQETSGPRRISPEDIVDVVAVGNPTMQHLFLGLSPLSLGQAPYAPFCREGGDALARDLGLNVAATAQVHVFPALSGFVGGDTIGALLTGTPEDFKGVKLMVDVGTNGEVVLSRDGELWVTSCATGPAFEGSQIECGMLATRGAIEKVWIDQGVIRYSVIGRGEASETEQPAGLCGSGVISAVATLARSGILKKSGAFDPKAPHRGIRKKAASGELEIVICPGAESRTGKDIVVTQRDIRAVQLGKAAMYAAVELIMKEAGVTRLERIFLAGTFGNYLDADDLVDLGMLSADERQIIEPIGNAAGDGARMALFNMEKRQRAVEIATRAHAIELSLRSDFQDTFVNAIGF